MGWILGSQISSPIPLKSVFSMFPHPFPTPILKLFSICIMYVYLTYVFLCIGVPIRIWLVTKFGMRVVKGVMKCRSRLRDLWT
jgi:hypothetical protein